MIYCKSIENHKIIGPFTENKKIAKENGFNITVLNVEQAWDGSWWEAGYVPSSPEDLAKKRRFELEQQVASMEASTGLIRPMREGILAEDSAYSEYTKTKAQEIEELAQELRAAQAAEQSQEPVLGPLDD